MSYPDYDDRDEPSALLLSETHPRARKEHQCIGCRRTIKPGERYRRRFYLFEGDALSDKTCSTCERDENGF